MEIPQPGRNLSGQRTIEYLFGKYSATKERLYRAAHKDRRRAILEAVTSPEDRLGENQWTPARDSRDKGKT